MRVPRPERAGTVDRMARTTAVTPGVTAAEGTLPRARDLPDGTYGTAVAALGKVEAAGRARASTARQAVGAVLAWVGAQRLRDALDGDPERVADREILRAAAEMEAACDRLDGLYSRRTENGPQREAEWVTITSLAGTLRGLLRAERAMLQARTARA